MDNDFKNKVAVVTGAGSGIGRSTALLLARLGATVHAADLDEQRVAAVVADIEAAGGRAAAHVTDVSDPASVAAFAERVFAAEGAVDILHNNAGVGHAAPVDETSLEEWQRVLGVNLMGVVHGIHSFVPRMLRQGRPAHVPVAEMAPYATSKHAVVGLSESLNAELSPRGIHVSAVCPGYVNTAIIAEAHLGREHAEHRDKIQRFYERFGCSPDVVAEAVVDAIRRKKLIRTVPRYHVVFNWALRRISPRAAQPFARLGVRTISRR
jgi:NAD(P)-dependent dehydrogenase (short-subunit alcohol dehydrogenase family)